MLNFAEQTGSGAVMLVWSFPLYILADRPNINQLGSYRDGTYNISHHKKRKLQKLQQTTQFSLLPVLSVMLL
jgi:hypothetical protein